MKFGIDALGRKSISSISRFGGFFVLTGKFLTTLKDIPKSYRLILEQIYYVGLRSFPLILIISIFVGAVSAWQAAYQFKFIGAPPRLLGQAVGKAVVMELAPVLSAIVFAGRVGAGIAAEIGTMRVTEQIDALESIGINPVRYLVLPRVVACTLMVPFLVILANFVAIMGALIVSVVGVDLTPEIFLNGFKDSFALKDFNNGLIKAAVFGLIIGLVGCYEGFTTEGGAQGVGRTTTSSVVTSSVLILIFNFIFAVILFRI